MRPASAIAAMILAGLVPLGARAADEVVTSSGETYSGSAVIDASSVKVSGTTIPLRKLVSIRFAESARFSTINQGLVTRAGDIVSGTVRELKGGVISVSSDLFGTLAIPKDKIRLVALRPSSIADLSSFAADFEGVELLNGDRAGGEITWVSADEIGVKTRTGIFRIPRKRAGIVSFGAGKKASSVAGPRLLVRLTNGDLLQANSPRLDGEELRFGSSIGRELKVGRSLLYELYASGGSVVHLSDLKPAKAKQIPQFDAIFPHRTDSSVAGGMLRVGSRSYQKGLGVHSKSVIEYDLSGGYSLFLAEIGIDEEVGNRGSVVFKVLVDGKQVFESGAVTGAMRPARIKAAVGGGKRLALVVDFGPDGADAGDHANWCMPVLIRK